MNSTVYIFKNLLMIEPISLTFYVKKNNLNWNANMPDWLHLYDYGNIRIIHE